MTEELPVHVSREETHSLDVPVSFETAGPFDVTFENHGRSVHVHLHLGDTLSKFASIEANNHYVEGDSRRAVRINVNTGALPSEPVLGKLKVVSGYGAQTRWIDVELTPPGEVTSEVEVDDSLAKPPTSGDSDSGEAIFDRPELPVLVLAALALGVAALAAVFLGDPLVIGGTLVVVVGVLVALYVLFFS